MNRSDASQARSPLDATLSANPNLRAEVVEAVANTVNGCLTELGFVPGLREQLMSTEELARRWQTENCKLFQDNTKLVEQLRKLDKAQLSWSTEALKLRQKVNTMSKDLQHLRRENEALKSSGLPSQYSDLRQRFQELLHSYNWLLEDHRVLNSRQGINGRTPVPVPSQMTSPIPAPSTPLRSSSGHHFQGVVAPPGHLQYIPPQRLAGRPQPQPSNPFPSQPQPTFMPQDVRRESGGSVHSQSRSPSVPSSHGIPTPVTASVPVPLAQHDRRKSQHVLQPTHPDVAHTLPHYIVAQHQTIHQQHPYVHSQGIPIPVTVAVTQQQPVKQGKISSNVPSQYASPRDNPGFPPTPSAQSGQSSASHVFLHHSSQAPVQITTSPLVQSPVATAAPPLQAASSHESSSHQMSDTPGLPHGPTTVSESSEPGDSGKRSHEGEDTNISADGMHKKPRLDKSSSTPVSSAPELPSAEAEDNNDDEDDDIVQVDADGLRLPADVVSIIFRDAEDNDSDDKICQLCSHRHENNLTSQPAKLYHLPTLEELVEHVKTEHPPAWEKLRHDVGGR